MNKSIIHTEMLDFFTLLDIRLHYVPEAEKYTFSIVFLDELGESYGSAGNEQWYKTQAACHAISTFVICKVQPTIMVWVYPARGDLL